MAAASLMLVAGNSRNEEDAVYTRMRCFNDAESGLLIGAGWLRQHPASQTFIRTNQGWPGNTITLFTDAVYDNGSLVTVRLVDNMPATPSKSVIATAVHGTESRQVSWDVGAEVTGGPTGNGLAADGLPILVLTHWHSP